MGQKEILAREREEYISSLYKKLNCKVSYKIGDIQEVMLPMQDGIKLRTNIHFPYDVEKAPVIIVRCCYTDMSRELNIHAQEYCKRGYIFIVQWCRGIGESEGIWEPNVNEREDGITTLNWVAEQEFAESIGYWGNSYLALTGWCIADQVPEKVKTMYLGVYGTDRHVSAYKDGLFRQDILTAWAMGNAGTPIQSDYITSCKYRPQEKVDEELWGRHLDWYRDWICNESVDSKYWSKGFWKMLKDIPSKVKIPIYIREGWYDHHLGSALVTYQDLSEESREHTTLQIGPWNHGYETAVQKQDVNGLKDDSVSSPFEWFEKTLKRGIVPEKEILFYAIGDQKWLKLEKYPVTPVKYKRMYLDMRQNKNAFSLVYKAGSTDSICYTYNPDNPVMSHGAESLFYTKTEVGSLLQEECGYRDDVISFVSKVFHEETEICGKINVRLYVSSNAEDTAFTAKIMEVFPDKETVNIRGSITTLGYRNSAKSRIQYKPNDIVEINIQMWDIAWKIQKDSKIRIDISSSDFPQYSVHSNYAENWAKCKKVKKAKQKIYTGIEYPSVVELPIL